VDYLEGCQDKEANKNTIQLGALSVRKDEVSAEGYMISKCNCTLLK
jgi:hypothetical protein